MRMLQKSQTLLQHPHVSSEQLILYLQLAASCVAKSLSSVIGIRFSILNR